MILSIFASKRIGALLIVYSIFCATSFAIDAPSVEILKDPEVSISKMKTFKIVTASELNPKDQSNQLLDKNLSFQIKDRLIKKGYNEAPDLKSANFVVTINSANSYNEKYIPPQTVYVPRYIPGETQYIQGGTNTYGSASIYDYSGAYGGSGNWTESSFTSGTKTTPDKIVIDAQTVSGYTRGYFYPSISIQLFSSTLPIKNIWSGSAIVESESRNMLDSSEQLIDSLMNPFPKQSMIGAKEDVLYLSIQKDGREYILRTAQDLNGLSFPINSIGKYKILNGKGEEISEKSFAALIKNQNYNALVKNNDDIRLGSAWICGAGIATLFLHLPTTDKLLYSVALGTWGIWGYYYAEGNQFPIKDALPLVENYNRALLAQ